VFVSPQGRPKVLDFGIAKLDPNLGGNLTATNPGQVMGTPAYMAPEQALGRNVDARSDVYAMGVILYEGVAGRVPFDGDTIYSVLHQVLQETPRPPSELRPGLPMAYEQIIYRALAKDPAARFQTAREMANALSAVTQTLPPDAFGTILPPEEALAAASLPIRPTPGNQKRSGPAGPLPAAPSPPASGGPGTTRHAGRKLAVIGSLAALASVAVVVALAVSGEPTKVPADARTAQHGVTPTLPSPPDAPAPTVVKRPAPAPDLVASKTSDGFLLNLRFVHPPDEVEWKLADDAAFHSIGDRTWIALPPGAGHAKIFVRYLQGKDWAGPFPLTFDPDAIVLGEARDALAAFPRWVTLSEKGHHRQLGFAFLATYRQVLRAIRYGFDEDLPSRTLSDAGKALEVPAGAHYVTVQVLFVEGQASDIRRFELGGKDAVPTKVVPAAPLSLKTGVDECDAIFNAVTECYRKTLAPDAFGPAAASLGDSAGVIRDLVTRGTPREDVVRTCRELRETYREASRGRGCEL
jgi:Protein kinase domain